MIMYIGSWFISVSMMLTELKASDEKQLQKQSMEKYMD